MRYNKGDKVKFLNDAGGGIVTRITGNLVHVETDDGFEIPVIAADIILERAAAGSLPETKQSSSTDEFDIEISEQGTDLAVSQETFIMLAFVPSEKEDYFDSYLINDSSYTTLYQILTLNGEKASLNKAGKLAPNTKIKIDTIHQTDINLKPSYLVQMMAFRFSEFTPAKPVNEVIEIKPMQFFKDGAFQETDYFDENALVYYVVKDDFRSSIEKMSASDVKKVLLEKDWGEKQKDLQKPKKSKDIEEVDLHIENLIDNHKELSNREILDMQLGRFVTTLEGAIKGNTKRIVFIHGVGNGKLKYELQKELQKSYPKLKYQDASFKEYGYGATMVML